MPNNTDEVIAHAKGTLTLTCNILGIQIINGLVDLWDIVIIYISERSSSMCFHVMHAKF